MSNFRDRTDYLARGMSGGHCETSVREEVIAVPGVRSVEVSTADGRLVIAGGGVDPAVLAAVGGAGEECTSEAR